MADPEYLFPVPRSVLIEYVERADRPLSDNQARVSYLLDQDRGAVREQTAYARQWGWSRKRVRYHWKQIVADVGQWRTFFKGHGGATEGPRRGHEQADSSPKTQVKGHGGATEGPRRGHLTIPDTDTDTDLKEKDALASVQKEKRARAKKPAFDDAVDKSIPPSRDLARAYFSELGAEPLAEAFYDHFAGNGWVVGKAKAKMRDWQAAARNWVRREPQFRSGKTKQNGTLGQHPDLTPGENFDRIRRAAEAALGHR